MRFTTFARGAATITAALLLAALPAAESAAAPTTYTFTTSTIASPISHPGLRDLLTGPVSGTFTYDPEGTGTHLAVPALGFASITLYDGVLTSITGAVDGHAFSDTTAGNASASNDGYTAVPGGADLYNLGADPLQYGGSITHTLAGFALGDYQLVNVRLFWIETLVAGTPDFLADEQLLPVLPTFSGRLALDFVSRTQLASPTPILPSVIAFFDGLVATPQPAHVPEPPIGGAALGVLAALAAVRRTRARPTRA